MTERFKVLVLKTRVPERVPRVRISLPPQKVKYLHTDKYVGILCVDYKYNRNYTINKIGMK